MHGRLAGAKRLPRSDGAAVARHGEKIFQIVPVEHELFTLDRAKRNLAAAREG